MGTLNINGNFLNFSVKFKNQQTWHVIWVASSGPWHWVNKPIHVNVFKINSNVNKEINAWEHKFIWMRGFGTIIPPPSQTLKR